MESFRSSEREASRQKGERGSGEEGERKRESISCAGKDREERDREII